MAKMTQEELNEFIQLRNAAQALRYISQLIQMRDMSFKGHLAREHNFNPGDPIDVNTETGEIYLLKRTAVETETASEKPAKKRSTQKK